MIAPSLVSLRNLSHAIVKIKQGFIPPGYNEAHSLTYSDPVVTFLSFDHHTALVLPLTAIVMATRN